MIITTVFILALVIFLLSVDASWSNVLSTERNDLVFEGRNQAYGAYALRKEEPKNMLIALLVSIALVGGGIAATLLANGSNVAKQLTSLMVEAEDIFLPPLPMDEVEEKQQENQEAASKASGMDNTEPEVVDNQPPTNPPSQDQMAGKKLGGNNDEEDDGLREPTPAADGKKGKGPAPEPIIKDVVDVMPQFPGGDKALMEFMSSRVHYNEWEKEMGVQGTIYMSLVVMADGSISHVKMEAGIWKGERLAKEAEKAILAMPRWSPGIQNGNPVPVRRRIPLSFVLKS